MMLTRIEPLSIEFPKIAAPDTMDIEGRIITLELIIIMFQQCTRQIRISSCSFIGSWRMG